MKIKINAFGPMKKEYTREYFQRMGKIGSEEFMRKTTKEQRIANAKKAAKISAIVRRKAKKKKLST